MRRAIEAPSGRAAVTDVGTAGSAAAHPREGDITRLQRSAGNAAASVLLAKRGHRSLPIQRQSAAETVTDAQPLERVVEALSRADPIAGVGDYPEAWRILNGLNMADMVRVLQQLERRSLFGSLAGSTESMAGVNRGRLLAAVRVIQMTVEAPTNQMLIEAAEGMSSLPIDQREVLLRALAVRGGDASGWGVEGASAILEGANPTTTVTPADLAAAAATVGPGPWALPPGQGGGLYIGTAAHIVIAAEYIAAHPGQAVYTNFIPLVTILRKLGKDPAVLGADALLRPDIANVTPGRQHLYEIKPSGSEHIGGAEAAMYIGLFNAAGYPMQLGSPAEPGTRGIMPAPGGYFMFYCLTPGVISYKYRRGHSIPTRSLPRRRSERRATFGFGFRRSQHSSKRRWWRPAR